MPGDLDTPAADVPATDMELTRRAALCPSERADAVAYDWTLIGFGIVAAGGLYPFILAVVLFLIVFTTNLISSSSGGPIELGLAFVTMSALGGAIGIVWSLFVSALTLPIIYFIAKSFNLRTSIVRLRAFSGGLVGFICTLPLSLDLPWYTFPSDVWQFIVIALGGPGLATVLGQLGGAWGGNRSRAAGPKATTALRHPFDPTMHPSSVAVEPTPVPEQVNAKFQFGIRHLLWLSVWLSLLLALIRLCGIPYELILPLLLGWTSFQAATLWLGERLTRRIAAQRGDMQRPTFVSVKLVHARSTRYRVDTRY